MPSATTIPHNLNKTLNWWKLEADKGSGFLHMGTIVSASFVMGRHNIPIPNVLSGHPGDMIQFNEPPQIESAFEDIYYKNFEIIAGVSTSDISAGTSSVTDELITALAPGTYETGSWIDLEHGSGAEGPVSSVSVTDTSDVAYTEGTSNDYVVDYATGRIGIVSGSTITNGETLKVDYTYNTQDGKKMFLSEQRLDTSCDVKATHQFSNGDQWIIRLYNARVISELNAEFVAKDNDRPMNIPVTFQGLEDDTKSAGEKFGYMTWDVS